LQKIAITITTPITIDTTTFSGVNKTSCELIVPTGSKAAYQAATGWKLFTNITEAIFVTLNTQGGNPAFPITTSASNSTISEPIIPIREGYTFAGWYKEATCTNAWNFATDVVTAPITLYAKWGIATSVENLQTTNYKIYPNPATSALYIANLSQDVEVSIISMDGKIVKQQKSVANDGKIAIDNLPKGVYLLKINSKAGRVTQRLIKQ
jgi:uncharacterized repeat protein (TIGR02543 family)